jgi:antitoxin VapB
MGMINLSQETEALALRLAAAKRLSVEATIQQAREAHALAAGIAPQARRRRDTSPEAVAARMARFDAFAQRIALAPINDPRPVSEIVDDLNAL